MAESVVDVWDPSMQLKIVLQKSHTVENVVRRAPEAGVPV